MKKLLLTVVLMTAYGTSSQASETINCRAANLSRQAEVTYFKVTKSAANISTADFKIAGKPYQIDVILSPDYLKISVKRKNQDLHYSKVWTNANLLQQFHFSFMDGRQKMAVICGQ